MQIFMNRWKDSQAKVVTGYDIFLHMSLEFRRVSRTFSILLQVPSICITNSQLLHRPSVQKSSKSNLSPLAMT